VKKVRTVKTWSNSGGPEFAENAPSGSVPNASNTKGKEKARRGQGPERAKGERC
jgi:hypothetical protein